MEKETIIRLITGSRLHEQHGGELTEIIDWTLEILGKPMHLRIQVTDGPARLSDMVPLARAVADKITAVVIDDMAAAGRPIQCRKGCSACCSYLVALSLPEVYSLRQIVASMPAECRVPVLHACIHAARKILDPSVLDQYHISRSTDMTQINQWYAGLRLKCPFLSAGSCSIYEQRPLACREHLVVTPSAWCDSRQNQSPQIADIPVSLLEGLGQLAAELQQTEVEAVILPLAVTGMDHYRSQAERTWPAVEMVQRFMQILETAASKSSQVMVGTG
jgi:Fe-S-cluster containining protein